MEQISGKTISYISLLLILCITAFLVAKFIVRNNISNDEIPVDTSTRM